MTHWEQPHWSGRPQPLPDPRPRLKPNAFARLARWSAHHAGLVIVMTIFFASLAAGLALFSIRLFPQAVPAISLDQQTASAQAKLDQLFPGIDSTFYARIQNSNTAYAHDSAMALAAELRRHGKLFSAAYVYGSGEFYERYGVLYLPADEVTARVTHALQLQPLFHALASAPNFEGLAALAKSIADAVTKGTPPVGLDEVLRPMAAAVEAEIAGKPQPVDWLRIAGLRTVPDSSRWHIIAKPVAGEETAAAQAAQVIGSRLKGLTWAFPPHTFDGQPPRLWRDIGAPALLSALMVAMLLAAGLGSLRQVAAVVAAGGAVLAIGAGMAAALDTAFDAVTWSLAAAVLAPALLFATTIAIGFGAARADGKSAFTAIMMAAQRGGPRIVTFATIALVLWLAWLPRQIDSLALMALSVAVAIAAAALLALTLVPAILTIGQPPRLVGEAHWLDETLSLPAQASLLNLRSLLALVVIGVAVFCTIFVPNVKFGDAQLSNLGRADLDTPNAIGAVHLVVPPDQARPAIERLGSLPEVGAVRWIDQFLPVDIATRQNTLKSLAGLLPPPAAASPSTTTPDLLAALDEDLKAIANSDAGAGRLSEAAHQLRRALQLFASGSMPNAARIAALEDALFAGLGRLAVEADRLAALPVPQASELDPVLVQHYAAVDGELRIEVLPRPEVTSLSFAAAMRRAFPAAAGVPIVALARNEIMHHETLLAYLPGLFAALVIAALLARRPQRIAVVLVPTPVMLTLAAAALVTGGELVDAASLAAFATAMAMSLAASLGIALSKRQDKAVRARLADPDFRAALLPLALSFAMVVPMMVSGSAPIASFAYVSSVLLGLAILANALIAPQIAAWLRNEPATAP